MDNPATLPVSEEKVQVFVVQTSQGDPASTDKMRDYDSLDSPRVQHSNTSATHGRVTLRLVVAVFFAVMGSFCFGYNTGVINAPEAVIKSFMNATEFSRTGSGMATTKERSLFALLVAIFAVGGCFGGVLAGWWANYFGRKNGMVVNAVIGFVAAALMYFSKMAEAYEMIIVGRLLIGFNCGVYTGLAPLYLSEISTADVRGALGVLHQLGVVTGILLSQTLGFPEVMGTERLWDVLLGLTFVPCLLQVLLFAVCPESPRYLLITKQQEGLATKALQVLRGTTDVKADIDEMKAEARQQASEPKVGLLSLFRTPSLRKPLMISVMMHLSQQLSGITGIFYYSASLFKGAGLSESEATHATSGVGGVMVAMTLVTIFLMDRAGRRTLHLVGLAGMFVFSVLITVTLTLRDQVAWFKTGSIVVSLIFVVFFALGPGSIPWLIVAEMFSQGPRPAAISVSVLVNWVANFLVGYSFPFIQSGLGDFAFLPFSGLILLFFIATYVWLPETKGRTFEDISRVWRAPYNQDGSAPDPDHAPVTAPPMEASHLVAFKSLPAS